MLSEGNVLIKKYPEAKEVLEGGRHLEADKVVVANIKVNKDDLATLNEGKWLNDQVCMFG